MSFGETYQAEVLASRRDRSRRALFWAKITSLVLMITVAVTLRAEPELRTALVRASLDTASKLMGVTERRQPTLEGPAQVTWRPMKTDRPAGAQPLTPDVKVNRFGPSKPAEAINLEHSVGQGSGFWKN